MGTRINNNDVEVPGVASIASLKITGGSPALGDILVSDSLGVFAPQSPSFFLPNGSKALANGVDAGSVSGLALPFTPSRIIASLSRPIGEDMIFACVNVGSITSDGFSFGLSAETTSANYVLDYIICQ